MYESLQIIVVDNASSDSSADFLMEAKANILFHKLSFNIGFAAACNFGAKLSHRGSNYLLFLNPDTIVFPDSISTVFRFMQNCSSSRVGICSIPLLDSSSCVSRSGFRFPSPANIFMESIGFSKVFPRLGRQMNEWKHDCSRIVDQVIGAFFFVRRCLYDDLNGFDPNFFVYYEDVDFSLRALRLGYYSYFLDSTSAIHVGGGCTSKFKFLRLFYSLKSRLYYFHKHFSLLDVCLVYVSTLAIEPFSRFAFFFFRLRIRESFEILIAYALLFQAVIRSAFHLG